LEQGLDLLLPGGGAGLQGVDQTEHLAQGFEMGRFRLRGLRPQVTHGPVYLCRQLIQLLPVAGLHGGIELVEAIAQAFQSGPPDAAFR